MRHYSIVVRDWNGIVKVLFDRIQDPRQAEILYANVDILDEYRDYGNDAQLVLIREEYTRVSTTPLHTRAI
jgi:hypothetical protein